MQSPARLFEWRGIASDGSTVDGLHVAEDESVLLQNLEHQGIILVKAQSVHRTQRLDAKSLGFLMKRLATLLNAGLPMDSALQLLYEQAPYKLKAVLARLLHSLKSGLSLSESLKAHLDSRQQYLINMIRIGEDSGKLVELLNELAAQKEKQALALRRLKRALTYPSLILVVAIAVMVLLLNTVVPQFEKSYSALGGALPSYTQLTLDISSWLERHGSTLLVILLSVYIVGLLLHRTVMSFRYMTSYIFLMLPLCGSLRRSYFQSFFASTLGLAYQAGVPIDKAMGWLPSATQDAVFKRALEKLKHDLDKGISLYDAIQQIDFFEQFMKQMIRIGVDSGQLAESLTQIANYYNDRFDAEMHNIMQWVEPALICIVAAVVAWIIAAMYIPIFTLGFSL